MAKKKTSKQKLKSKAAYLREWRAANPDKVKAAQARRAARVLGLDPEALGLPKPDLEAAREHRRAAQELRRRENAARVLGIDLEELDRAGIVTKPPEGDLHRDPPATTSTKPERPQLQGRSLEERFNGYLERLESDQERDQERREWEAATGEAEHLRHIERLKNRIKARNRRRKWGKLP